jgi:ATP-binding cassette subfamily F protein 3
MSTLLQINNLFKAYGHQEIFKDANLTISTKQKVGVIGRNGAGKSTLFKLIISHESIDSGTLLVHNKARLGYLEQQDPYELTETVIDFLVRYTGKEEWYCGKIAAGFQLKDALLYAKIGDLAGGYQMRVKLTGMLLKEPNLLLLDEPTNYLDLSTLLLLEKFLQNYRGGYLVISHDREFLKNLCDHTLDIEHGNLFLYPRPLEEYLAFKEEQLQIKQKHNVKTEQKQKQLQEFVDRFRAKATKARQAQSKLKLINSLKKIDILHPISTVRINIPKTDKKKGLAFRCKNLSIGYSDKVVADKITLDIERGKHVAILGDNGQGKTTFLKTLAGELPCIAGNLHWMPDIKTAYYAQHVTGMLNPQQEVEMYLQGVSAQEVSLQDIYKMASNFLFKGNDLKKKISVLSGGERARLCLAGLLLQKAQVLLLDEPNNHLDFETVEALGNALKTCNSTILFVSHNRTFVNLLATAIIEIKDGKASRYPHNYEEYVYHLEQTMLDDNNNGNLSPTERVNEEKLNDYQKRKLVNARRRKLNKKAKTVEDLITKHEREKQAIIKDFEINPVFSKERNECLAKVTKLLGEQETKWIALQEELEQLGAEI